MLKRPRRDKEINCFGVMRKEARFRRPRKPRRRTPARSMREAVRKRGGEWRRVSFPKEKMVDQRAYMRTMRDIRELLF